MKHSQGSTGSSVVQLVREREWATLGYLAGWKGIRAIPEPVARVAFRMGADIASRRGAGMDQLRANLSRVVGRENVTRELVRDSVRSYARYWLEAFRLPGIASRPGLFDELVASVSGLQHLDASLAAGKGTILCLPHCGNWDMAGLMVVHYCGGFTTVAERLKPEALYQAFVDYRESLGFTVLPLSGGPHPFPLLKNALARGEVVCLLGERDLRRRGQPVTFFGESTTFPVGSVQLARETGAQLHVADCWFTDPQGWAFSISPPIDVAPGLQPALQEVADRFAENIARHPQDWHLLQPLWPADVPQRKRQ